jgi:deazaflavin-dependent oxidoreductase (nitroreductase family)
LLTHVGRRTGLRRRTVLEVLEYRRNGPEVVVMSGFGPNADWLRNLETTADPEITVGSRRFRAIHRRLGEAEAVEVLARYEQRNRLVAPVIRSVLSRLLGWRYHATDVDRHRLVAQLPLVEFRPRSVEER